MRVSFLRLSAFVLAAILGGCGSAAQAPSALAEHYPGPNESLTPGDLCSPENPDFDGYRYGERIPHCRRNVSSEEKYAIAATYGIPASQRREYEIDHRIPLNIGGSNRRANLWPLKVAHAREKSEFEQALMNKVAEGRVRQARAIEMILNWTPGSTLP